MHQYPSVLHIVAFDIPYPANYGGVIDIYYKIEAIAKQGVDVILHCYQYGKKGSKRLNKICKEVHYYPRRTFKNPFYGKLPYIVNSRNSAELLQNLNKDNNPILFEGLHCTYYLDHPSLASRFKIVRMHNIEHHYYSHLERAESKYFKKYFFRVEADRLKKHQHILKHANLIAAISPNDYDYLSKRFEHVVYLPAFHPNNKFHYPGKQGDFILYHGNLAVAENYEAAILLVKEVFSKLDFPCIIAGNNPPVELVKITELYPHIQLRQNIRTEDIHELIEKAQVNVLFTNQNTGIKLKLLNALYRGKHVVVNPLISDHTGLETLCEVGESFEEMTELVKKSISIPYEYHDYEQRKEVLGSLFNNAKNAQSLLENIYEHGISREHTVVKPTKRTRSSANLSFLLSYFFG